MKRVLVALLAAGAALLAGCTGVPDSSAPQVVQTVGGVQQVQRPVVTPQPGADPREIVAGFLANNAANDEHHSGARAFLTPEAKNRWSDAAPTTIVDNPQVGNVTDGSITVHGHIIGTLDASGAYTPSLQGDGTGGRGSTFTLTLGLKQVNGEWRIDQLPNGLLISAAQFDQYYTQRSIYFYDQAEERLIPDPRYSALADPTLLATWLMTQMVTQPQGTALPSIPNPSQVKVDVGSVLTVEIPGASQLDANTRDRMAAQIALTLDQASRGAQMEITDGGKPVSIPHAGGAEFTAGQFTELLSGASESPRLYYVSRGGIMDDKGKPLPGKFGDGTYGLNAVALAQTASASRLLVAGTAGPASDQRLLIGQTDGELRETGVHGQLSRPAWVPNLGEAWVGDGQQLVRVAVDGHPNVVQMTASSGTVSGRIRAVRFSPEGSRIALVISSGNASQIWVGTVVRAGEAVRVTGLNAISPLGIKVTDVAWNDQLELFTIGHELSSGTANVWVVQCDGSHWTARGIGNIPAPDSITVAERQEAAVSAGGAIFVQSGQAWINPPPGPLYGTNPIYSD